MSMSGVMQSFACLQCDKLYEPETDLDNRLMGIIIFACTGCGSRIKIIHNLFDMLEEVDGESQQDA